MTKKLKKPMKKMNGKKSSEMPMRMMTKKEMMMKKSMNY